MDRMAAFGPLFCDITWGAGGSTADLTLEIASRMQNMVCMETMMHLTCTNMPVEKLNNALKEVRGDAPEGHDTFTPIEGGFACALDLIKHIRKEYGDYFGIGIAGYPEAHPDSILDDEEKMKENYWRDIHYLKQKVKYRNQGTVFPGLALSFPGVFCHKECWDLQVDAGGDFIVSQLFYETGVFLQFVEDCRSVGITVPILPGIMPIMTYGGFKRMTSFCKTKVPQKITDALESIKDDDEAVKKYGIKLGTEMCRQLLDSGVPGLHMYTLNLERSAVSILEDMGLVNRDNLPRHFPWRPPTNVQRSGEAVRPIFWSNRPKSYIKRTADWDAFPSGRWGDSQSPAYGTLNDYQFMRRHTSSEKRAQKAREAWGDVLSSVDDVKQVFVNYCKGEINILPWNEMDSMQKESAELVPKLQELNKKGYLTITSQPRVNGAPSTDSTFGWGGPGGYVYQKAYIEFFVSPEGFSKLQPQLNSAPSISYMAVNSKGELHTTLDDGNVNAVTWGVFPGKEILQPTVVDPRSFMVWKDEAFDLWITEWSALYDGGSQERKVLQEIRDEWYLVSVVDNDFVHGDIFKVFGLGD
ncbi:unnamed protein product [Ostreobium quekettii]|uniref:MTHFR SAM-binding regulatory domain-containing protein n=1 Tax=Ostreobium quekettii TaxID=121088 RepID=A0A8S1JAV4_9CHLO|nr:unnamed protein product [Ostreobium quekettii]